MDLERFLKEITEKDGVSGYEGNVAGLIDDAFTPYIDHKKRDNMGNLIFLKKGKNDRIKVLLCAHMDEIGLIVTRIEEKGFLRFTSLGGFDPRTLPGQEVIVHGSKPLHGIIGFKTPHLYKENERNKGVEMEDLFIDTGLPEDIIHKEVKVGSIVSIKRNFLTLLGDSRSGKAMDDRAGVAVLLQCARELSRLSHEADVYLTATVQEEVGIRGAVVATYGTVPHIGIAVDVCHGDFPGAKDHEVSPLGKGPVITSGPNIHPFVAERLADTAREYHLPYQKDVSPGPTGTDARAIQISMGGVPTGLLSIPLRYMHTSVELANLEDIKVAGILLAYFITGLSSDFVEGLSCL